MKKKEEGVNFETRLIQVRKVDTVIGFGLPKSVLERL